MSPSIARFSRTAIALFFLGGPLGAQSVVARIDAVFARFNKHDSPGCAVAVSEGGQTVFAKGYGSASLEHDLPITPTSLAL